LLVAAKARLLGSWLLPSLLLSRALRAAASARSSHGPNFR
jgi:hypothetical protein